MLSTQHAHLDQIIFLRTTSLHRITIHMNTMNCVMRARVSPHAIDIITVGS